MRDEGADTRSHTLSLRGLTKVYGDLAAVEDVDLEIERGKFVTILGPSGGGKTTVLMSIAGFVEPTRGEILLDGRDITALPPDHRNFGMVFQGYALFPHMTVADNLWFPLRVRGVTRRAAADKIRNALALVQMEHLGSRYPTQLSGGQQQRVALARALVFEPDLLLLDEPLSALDKKLRADLQWELKSLHERLGTTFLYVTHDQEEALSMSDEIVIMRQGRIEQRGAPGELYERPATRFVADFLGKSNFIAGKAGPLEDGMLVLEANGVSLRQATGAGGVPVPGTETLLALRPEKIHIAAAADKPDLPNLVPGEIAAFNYYGSSFHFRVQTDAFGELTVASPAWTCNVEQTVGARVWLGWSADASVIVADS